MDQENSGRRYGEAIGELDHTTLKSLVKSLDFTPSAMKELSEHHPTCRAQAGGRWVSESPGHCKLWDFFQVTYSLWA